MQPSASIINKSTAWNALLKPRVGTIVVNNGSYYTNMTGKNAVLSDTATWFKVFAASVEPLEFDLDAGDIAGSDPDFYIDLSSYSVPEFPLKMSVWVALDGSDYQPVEPVVYSPLTSLLGGMSSPDDFPDQLIKVKVL